MIFILQSLQKAFALGSVLWGGAHFPMQKQIANLQSKQAWIILMLPNFSSKDCKTLIMKGLRQNYLQCCLTTSSNALELNEETKWFSNGLLKQPKPAHQEQRTCVRPAHDRADPPHRYSPVRFLRRGVAFAVASALRQAARPGRPRTAHGWRGAEHLNVAVDAEHRRSGRSLYARSMLLVHGNVGKLFYGCNDRQQHPGAAEIFRSSEREHEWERRSRGMLPEESRGWRSRAIARTEGRMDLWASGWTLI